MAGYQPDKRNPTSQQHKAPLGSSGVVNGNALGGISDPDAVVRTNADVTNARDVGYMEGKAQGGARRLLEGRGEVMKTKKVVVKMEVSVTVDLPEDKCRQGNMCDDPAIEAALEAMPGAIEIFIWGEDKAPVKVYVEAHEEDCEIEDDER